MSWIFEVNVAPSKLKIVKPDGNVLIDEVLSTTSTSPNGFTAGLDATTLDKLGEIDGVTEIKLVPNTSS